VVALGVRRASEEKRGESREMVLNSFIPCQSRRYSKIYNAFADSEIAVAWPLFADPIESVLQVFLWTARAGGSEGWTFPGNIHKALFMCRDIGSSTDGK